MSGGSMTLDPTSRGWPMKSSVSSSPISSTTPTSSWPSVNGQGSGRGQWPLRMWRSVPQTPQAAMRMSAALGGTSGFVTSRITGGSPGPSKVATRTFGMDPPNGKQGHIDGPAPSGYGYTRENTQRLQHGQPECTILCILCREDVSGKEAGRVKGKLAALVGPAEVEVPDPEPGAVLAKVRRANVCGSEVHIYHFRHPLIRECVLGHEFVGEILALGEGVSTDYAGDPVEVGDRVIAPYFLTCRRCQACLRGDFNLCQKAYTFWSKPPEDNPHFHGAFATHYYLHPEQYFYKVSDSVSDNTVAGANCGLSQVLFGLHQTGLSTGDSLLIQGAGGLGLYAAAVGRDMGARVIVVEGIRQRIDLARRFGAEEIVDMNEYPEAGDRVRQVQSLTDGYGADVVLEVSGVPAAFAEALQLVRPGGRVIEIGNVSVGKEHEVSLAS